MSTSKVIIFGPTGSVGSAAARNAATRGAQVVLAMRDPSKAIPGLDAAMEKQHGMERVKADLTQPETVRAAVAQTGAKRAFFYLQYGSSDSMRATLEALKAGGIELPVFLSSFTVRGDPAATSPDDMISYAHAMVEVNLANVFGASGFVALRPGCFASNSQSWYQTDITRREFHIWAPDAGVDAITNEDIGRVAAAVLANGPPKDGAKEIYLYGPTLMTHMDFIKKLVKGLGIDAKIDVTTNEKEAIRQFVEDRHMPEPVARSIINSLHKSVEGKNHVFGYSIDPTHLNNVEKYSGEKPWTFEDWVRANKAQLVA